MPSRRTTRTTARLLSESAAASINVIASRMRAFADPAAALSPWHRAELQRMSGEKLAAVRDGMSAAAVELSLMPLRCWQLAMQPSAWTPAGWMRAWMQGADLWLGVGDAALRPAASTVVRNRGRLARRSRKSPPAHARSPGQSRQ